MPKGSVTVTVTNGDVELRREVRNPFQRHAGEGRGDVRRGSARRLRIHLAITLGTDPGRRRGPHPQGVQAQHDHRRGEDPDYQPRGHTIYLTGTVSSTVAMRQAVETASHAPGVGEVDQRPRHRAVTSGSKHRLTARGCVAPVPGREGPYSQRGRKRLESERWVEYEGLSVERDVDGRTASIVKVRRGEVEPSWKPWDCSGRFGR